MNADLRLLIPASACWLTAALTVGQTSSWLTSWCGMLTGVSFALTALLVLTVALPRLVASRRPERRPGPAVRPRSRRLGTVVVALASVGVVFASIGSQAGVRSPPSFAALDGHSVTVVLTVGSAAVESDVQGFSGAESSTRFTATASRVTAGGREYEVRMPVLVFVAGKPRAAADSGALSVPESQRAALDIGSRVRLKATLKAADPGESVAYLLFSSSEPIVVEPVPWYLGWANQLRAQFMATASLLPGDGAQLVPGLALGDVSQVSDDLNSSMIDSGLSHLTAVSGANCAIVVAAIMMLGGAFGLSRRWRIAASLALMTAFVVLVTPSASVVRAAVMATIVLVALASGRSPRGMPALAFASMVMLVADPWLSRSYGLALSVLATAGLLLFTPPLQQLLARWLPARLSLVIAVPVAAQLACQPVLVLLAPKVSTYSVFANLLAEPAAPIATVVGLISCLVGAIAPPLAPVGAWLTWVPASWIAGVATFFARAPGSSIPWPGGVVGVALVVLLTGLMFVALFLRESPAARARRLARARPPVSSRRERARTDRRRAVRWGASVSPVSVVRVLSGGAVALTVIIWAGSGIGATLHSASWPTGWHIAACDIGQGDSVVVRDPDTGSVALVDVGPDPALLTTCLHRLGVTTIDLLVLTHYDLDHVGGLDAVVGHVKVALLGPPDDTHNGGHDTSMASELNAGGADVRHPTRGDSGSLGDVGYSILWPEAGTDLRGNDACVTVQFSGPIRSLFLGDLGQDSQRMMMAANTLQHEDAVKVAHHGSADQSEDLYQAISATVGIISVGMNNRYGHPTDRLLGILARAQTIAYRTDLLGMIVLTPTAGGISVWSDGAARVEKKG